MGSVLFAVGATAAHAQQPPAEAAGSGSLEAPTFGIVDFGDGVDVTITGEVCDDATTLVRVTTDYGTVEGPVTPGCAGVARVPTYSDVTALGWRQGDRIEIEVISGGDVVPLRYQRVEVDRGTVALGDPRVVTEGSDPETGTHDPVVVMNTGDSIDLGPVNLDGIDSVSLRMCLPQTEENDSFLLSEIDTPLRISITEDTPFGPLLVGPIDGSSNPTTFFRLQSNGFGDSCWRLAVFPLSGTPSGSAPNVVLNVQGTLPDTFQVNSIDFNGTGARSPHAPNWVTPDPEGMETIFDGSSFEGWAQSGCILRDGAATIDRTGGNPAEIADCLMTHDAADTDRVIRLEVRREHFYDNGGIYVPTEVQLRSAGEFLPGGYFMEYAARWQKLNAWPTWSQMEIIQLGERNIVRINGRTVTDHDAFAGAPEPHQLGLVAQPMFSYRASDSIGMGNELQVSPADVPPQPATPSEWGAFWFRDVRVLDCDGPDDSACTALAAANEGQVFRS